jgi:hypothetical protein
MKRFLGFLILVCGLVLAASAAAQEPSADGGAPKAAGLGVAVIGVGSVRDDAFTVARAVYASRLRPPSVDEQRARVLAGDPAPPGADKEVRELAELRSAITGEDAASRRLLASVAQQLGVEAVLVVRGGAAAPPSPEAPAQPTWGGDSDAGSSDAGSPPATGPVEARLFLVSTGDFDAARYIPEPGVPGALAWRATVASLERRFGPAPPPPTRPQLTTASKPQEGETRPFYSSPWFWGALAAAVLVGGAFYLATRDTSDQPIHLEMHVPK